MSETLRTAAHAAVRLACKPSQLAFERGLKQVKETQLSILADTLRRVGDTPTADKFGLHSDIDLEEFQQRVPVSDYTAWEELIEQQRESGQAMLTDESCRRYQPTSGSTSKMKWIPYSPAFLKEVDRAIGPWVSDLYGMLPGGRSGRHFWSISWVPTALRKQIAGNVNDDSKLLPWWKSMFMGLTMAVPQDVAQAQSSEASVFASLCYLAATEDLTVMSVWSPTFALNFFEQLAKLKDRIASSLEHGRWDPLWAAELAFLRCPRSPHNASVLRAWDGRMDPAFFQALWPQLSLVSSWATSSSRTWAERLHGLLPQAHFQGKGLLATEGVVTFPYRGRYPLAVSSHFYEFRDLGTQEVLPAWKLEKGQIVQPILTTGNGLLRYAMKDRMLVDAFLEECPSFEFLGRLEGIDMVGEKMAPETALQALELLEELSTQTTAFTLFAIPQSEGGKARYLALLEGVASLQNRDELAAKLEELLLENFHYRLARDLDQLAPAAVYVGTDASEIYYSLGLSKGMVVGNMKVEPLVLWDRPLHPALELRSESSNTVSQRNVRKKEQRGSSELSL